jgi:AcrR family transcriptional regulator
MNNDSLIPPEKQPEKKRGERRRARTRAELLLAARQVFAQRGYHDASIAEITEQADMAVGTFYLHFRDKDEAFMLVLEQGFRETLEQVKQAVARETSEHTLAVVVRAIFRHAYSQSDLFRVALMAGAQFARMMRVQDAIEEVLTTALDEQDLAGYELPLLVRFLTGMILQGIIWWFDNETPTPDEMADQMLSLLQYGLPARVITGTAPRDDNEQ